MENIFDVEKFSIMELETIEAPLTDYQAGAIVGGVLAIEVAALIAVAAC